MSDREGIVPGCGSPRTPPADAREVRDVPKEPCGSTGLMERVAARVHEIWAVNMRYVFSRSTESPDGSVTIPADTASHLRRLVATPYNKLPAEDVIAPRLQAHEILDIARSTDPPFLPNRALTALSAAVGHPCLEPRWNEELGDALVRYVIERYIRADAAETRTVPMPENERPSELDALKEAYWAAIRRLRELGERSVPLV